MTPGSTPTQPVPGPAGAARVLGGACLVAFTLRAAMMAIASPRAW